MLIIFIFMPKIENKSNREKRIDMTKKANTSPPAMNPYVFTFLLVAFGLWCFYDGFLTSDPEMLEHATFNRVASIALLTWGIYDFFKIRRKQKKKTESEDK